MLDSQGARRSRRLSPRARQTLSWLLAPILAVGAIALQISLDVPQAEMLEREDKPKTTKRKSATRTPPRERKPAPKRWKPRSTKELAALRETWSEAPLEDEPSDQLFRRRHEAFLRAVATRTRSELLSGQRLVTMQIRPTCRTLRCALELCGPEPLLEQIAEVLPGLRVVDQPLWHDLREVEPKQPPPEPRAKAGSKAGSKSAAGDEQVCRRWIVDFAVQGPKTTDLRIPKLEPDEP